MKRTIELTLREPRDEPDRRYLPARFFGELQSKFPEFVKTGFRGRSLHIPRLPEDSPRLTVLIGTLWSYGFRPVVTETKGPMVDGTYPFIPRQVAEPSDLDDCDFLQFIAAPENGIGDIFTGIAPDGKVFTSLNVGYSELRPEVRLGYLTAGYTGCSLAFRQLMEAEGFAGLSFEMPPLKEGFRIPPGKELEIVTASVFLPKLKNAVSAVIFDGCPITEEEAKMLQWSWIEPDYRPATLRFDRDEFDKLGSFDIARTQELDGAGRTREQLRPHLVVSQRFRRWLDSHGLECHYHPIRLEQTGDPPPDPPLAAICRELGMPLTTVPG